MAKVIRTAVDAEGNVTIAFSGFVGSECEAEENRLRRDLAQYGLSAYPKRVERRNGVVSIRQRTATPRPL